MASSGGESFATKILVVGPKRSGKSTLANFFAELDQPRPGSGISLFFCLGYAVMGLPFFGVVALQRGFGELSWP